MTSSPLLRPVPQSGSPLLHSSAPQQQQQQQQQEIHPLLAMLSQNAQNSAQPLPAMPIVAGSPQPSPYTSHPGVLPASSASPALLTPLHFLTSSAPASTNAPAASAGATLLASLQAGNAASSPPASAGPPVMTRGAFQSYVLSLCNDAATVDWLYQRYLARPGQHPFA